MAGLPAKPASLINNEALPGPAAGTIVDGYWRVQQIGPQPQNAPDNYEYLLLGKTRVLLIDAGAGSRDIHAALTTLTYLPVTAIPTHLHYDHTNGLRYFSSIALINLPETRPRERNGFIHLGRYQYLDWFGPQGAPVFRPTEWVPPNSFIDLGGRRVQVLLTPGPTPRHPSQFMIRPQSCCSPVI
jgi:glyoxylase-like metal-dependent hydrolase (beta-lactamase superfamily II)